MLISYAKMLVNHSSGHLYWSLTADTALPMERSNQRAKPRVENDHLCLNYDPWQHYNMLIMHFMTPLRHCKTSQSVGLFSALELVKSCYYFSKYFKFSCQLFVLSFCQTCRRWRMRNWLWSASLQAYITKSKNFWELFNQIVTSNNLHTFSCFLCVVGASQLCVERTFKCAD